MKKMSNVELKARINRFMDKKMSKIADYSHFSGATSKARRSPRVGSDVSDSPYIMLAIR